MVVPHNFGRHHFDRNGSHATGGTLPSGLLASVATRTVRPRVLRSQLELLGLFLANKRRKLVRTPDCVPHLGQADVLRIKCGAMKIATLCAISIRAISITMLVGTLCLGIAFPAGQTVGDAPVVPQYPNTAAGLEELMSNMIALQKKGDSKMLASYLQSLVLPDAEHWFVAEFGDNRCGEQNPGANDCMGPRFASSYQRLARIIPASFSLTLQDLIDEGLTNFEATNIAEGCSGPLRIVPDRNLLGGLTTTPMVSEALPGPVRRREPVYALWIYSEKKQTTLPFFVYSEGSFRYLGMLHEATFDEFRKGKSIAETAQPAPEAHYLTEDQLEVKNAIVDPTLVQRTVVLRVVAGADGKPREVTYVRGPEAYKEAAIESTKKRRFDLPKYPFEAFHAKTLSFCLNVVAPH